MIKDNPEPEPEPNIKKTLNDLKTAMNNLEKTMNLLHRTENNMQDSQEFYGRALLKQQQNKIVRYGFYGIQSLEEKASQMENEYITMIIEDTAKGEVIIFSPTDKSIRKKE